MCCWGNCNCRFINLSEWNSYPPDRKIIDRENQTLTVIDTQPDGTDSQIPVEIMPDEWFN